MPKYRVRLGCQLPHAGLVYGTGSVVELSRSMGYEVRHLVEEVDSAGQVVTVLPPAWRQALETIRDHERLSVLLLEQPKIVARLQAARDAVDEAEHQLHHAQDALTAVTKERDDLEAAIATEHHQAATTAEAKPPEGKADSDRKPVAGRKPSAAADTA